MQPILLFGPNGQIGWELQRTLAPLGPVAALNRKDLDLANHQAIRSAINDLKPRLIVNAAAYTAVDKAETESEAAMAVNATAVGVMAEEAKRIDSALVHYSTDYVFDGRISQPRRESDSVAPANAYGRTKLAGENAIIGSGCQAYLIFRTCWVYADRGSNFLRTIQRLAGERDELRVVDDQLGSPTWARLIAETTAQVLAMTQHQSGWATLAERGGIYHLAADGICSWFDFARAIVAATPRNDGTLARVLPIPSSDYPTPAARPAYSVLDTSALQSAFGLRLPDWQQGLALCLSTAART
ncbi:MAG: dTDP-4-dehydrorhamnose reductase [Rhodospirillales bacterium]|nr:dTDP-4-dehydrorhamnose reductase [Rhodospirillales bacterium]